MSYQPSSVVPSPQVFGPSSWRFLHYIAYGYPHVASPGLQQKTLQFLDALPYLLPCEKCGEHLHEYLTINNPSESIKTRNGLIDYMHKLHNTVNQRLGKPTMSYRDAENELFANTNGGANMHLYLIIMVVFVIGMLVGVATYPKFF